MIEGTATAPSGIRRVQVEIMTAASRYLQDNMTTWGGSNTILATLSPGTGSTRQWSLPVTIADSRVLKLQAKTIGTSASDATKAVKKIETFLLGDRTPDDGDLLAVRRAADHDAVHRHGHGQRRLRRQRRQPLHPRRRQQLPAPSPASSRSDYTTFRIEPDVIGATAATWRYDVVLPHEGDWKMGAMAVDTTGQSDLRWSVRDWTVDSTGVPPRR